MLFVANLKVSKSGTWNIYAIQSKHLKLQSTVQRFNNQLISTKMSKLLSNKWFLSFFIVFYFIILSFKISNFNIFSFLSIALVWMTVWLQWSCSMLPNEWDFYCILIGDVYRIGANDNDFENSTATNLHEASNSLCNKKNHPSTIIRFTISIAKLIECSDIWIVILFPENN